MTFVLGVIVGAVLMLALAVVVAWAIANDDSIPACGCLRCAAKARERDLQLPPPDAALVNYGEGHRS